MNYEDLFHSRLFEKEEDIKAIELDDLYQTFGENRIKRIFGLPFAYNDNSDPFSLSFNESILSDLPVVNITPGFIKYRGSISLFAQKILNFIGSDLLPISTDERKVKFVPAFGEYVNYLNSMASILFNEMVIKQYIIDDQTPFISTTIEDFLAAYTFGGLNNDFKEFLKGTFNISEDNQYSTDNIKKAINKAKEKQKEELDKAAKANSEASGKDVDKAIGFDVANENLKGSSLDSILNNIKNPEEKKSAQSLIDKNINKLLAKDKRDITLQTLGFSFFMDASSSISEDFSNSYSESSVSQEQAESASKVRGELFEKDVKGWGYYAASKVYNIAESILTLDMSRIVGGVTGLIKGSIGTVTMKGMALGAISSFPEIWNSSSFSKNYRLSFKFSSPYGDPVSVFLNVYLPMLALMGFVMPRRVGPEEFVAPFIVKIDAPGYFSTDLGVITDMTIQRGGDSSSWTVESYPTTLDISLTVKDLVPSLIMSDNMIDLVASGSTRLYLSNLAGVPLDPENPLSLSLKRRLMITTNAVNFKYSPNRIVKKTISEIEKRTYSFINNYL